VSGIFLLSKVSKKIKKVARVENLNDWPLSQIRAVGEHASSIICTSESNNSMLIIKNDIKWNQFDKLLSQMSVSSTTPQKRRDRRGKK
jgi:hypothetical protein